MNTTIHKYTLTLDDFQTVIMPTGANIIRVAEQQGKLCIWAEVDPEASKHLRKFMIVGTGRPLPPPSAKRVHIDTVVMPGGNLVVHVYELLLGGGL